MTAVRDHPQRRPQPARVLHPVLERHPVVLASPEAEARAADAIEVEPRVGRDQRLPDGERVSVLGGSREERLGEVRIDTDGVGEPPPAERDRAATRRRGPRAPAPRDDAPGLDQTDSGDDGLRDAAVRGDPRRRSEDDARDGLGPPDGCPQSDETAERMADPRRRQRVLTSRTARTASANGSRVGAAASGAEPPCPGSSGTITRRSLASAGASARQFEAAPPSPWTRRRRSGASDRVTERRSAVPQLPRLEPREKRCGVRRHRGIFFNQWMFR
jgi:hypothetical protein